MKSIGHFLRRLMISFLSGLAVWAVIIGIAKLSGATTIGFFAAILFLAAQLFLPLWVAYLVFVSIPPPKLKVGKPSKPKGSSAMPSADKSSAKAVDVKLPGNSRYDTVIMSASEFEDYLSRYKLIDRIYTKVAGVSYPNKDGTSRQDILALCHGGDEVALRRFLYDHTPAYAVFTRYGQIGNLPAETSRKIDFMYDGCTVRGTISARTGGGMGLYGCNLLLEFYREKDTPDPPQSSSASDCVSDALNVSADRIAEMQWYAAHTDVNRADGNVREK